MDGLNGVHHLAICTADMRRQLDFFTDVLGAELKALYWMHGVEKTFHGFVRLNDSCYVAFVQNDRIATVDPEPAVSHAGSAGGASAPGTMQHVALSVDSEDELLAMRDRIRDRGVNVSGVVDHGLCKSIYFAGPEGLVLEVATSETAIDGRAWIDPEVVELIGIDQDELERLKHPARYQDRGGRVAQPPIDPAKPHGTYPPGVYEMLITTPDEVITSTMSEPTPPVKVTDDS